MNENVDKHKPFDVERIRRDFPILSQQVRGKPLVFLDSAASAQKPQQVIDAMMHYYQNDHANVHRGIYMLSERATQAYEQVRGKVKEFIGARSEREIVFVKGATEAINLIAQTYGQVNIQAGDEIIVSEMEHHANIVPWQMLCKIKNAKLKVIPVLDTGALDLNAYEKMLSKKTKLVSIIHASNVLGALNPAKDIIRLAHTHNVPVLLDGAQSITHVPIDVQALDCDFYVFSAHKMYGPTGVGVLYAKEELLTQMPPYQGGGSMIKRVSFEQTEYADIPMRFEAGTPNIAGVVGLGAAIDYLNAIGMRVISAYEHTLLQYAHDVLSDVGGLTIIGAAAKQVPVISFVMDHIHAHDIATVLDHEGVAVRAGHHCAMPLMKRFGVSATVRVSFGLYNTRDEIDILFRSINEVKRLFSV